MLRLWLILSFVLFAHPAFAVCDGKSDFWSLPEERQQQLQDLARQSPFPEGILWQVEKDGVTSFVAGTMHLYDPRHQKTMGRIEPLIERSEQVFLETTSEQDEALKQYITAHPEIAFLTEGPSLIDLLGDEAWEKLLPLAKSHGVPGFIAAKYQPWLLGLTISIPTCAFRDIQQKKKGLDRLVEAHAQDQSLTIRSLDEIEATLALLTEDPLKKQVADLKWSLQFDLINSMSGDNDISDHYFREQTQLSWEYSIAKAIDQFGEKPENRDRIVSLMTEFMEKLIEDRNISWVETLAGELAQTPSLVAVGALHLPGENGVLALLQRQGFTITRLPLTGD